MAESRLLDRYRILRRLGVGGMATVYLCEDERLGRRVAVKRLHADSPAEMARRLEREARVAASLNHPNLVPVYDVAHDGESVLMVMEHVEGETLAAALRRGPLAVEDGLELVRGVAAALDHAHQAGVVHRDVKPANVLMADGGAKLLDLGIAQAAELTKMTATGTALGTPVYMAPEQLEGRSVGPEADVYALAAVAYETLSGRRARTGANALEVAHRVTTEPPPDLRAAWPEAPPAAARALRRGLDRDPQRRQRTAGELAVELGSALEGPEGDPTTVTAPVPATASAPPRPAPPPARPAAPSARPAPPPSRPAATSPPPAPPARRRRVGPWLVTAAAVVLAALSIALLLGAGSGDGGGGSDGGGGGASEQAGGAGSEPSASSEQPGAGASATDAGAESTSDAARGAALNDQGKRLIDSGQPEEAVPVLQRSVESFPEGSTDVNYAYALFNLGNALRLSGRPEEAIPVLERRLQIPNQRATVARELELARQEAGEGGSSGESED
jgi:tRNA A-37 threonylcarbamoyl transferase component Bud32/tetratricopeptide (TPR) repeat protein